MRPTPAHETKLEQVVLQPLRRTGPGFYYLLAGLGLVFLAGVAALARQWAVGLGVTGLGRPLYWGFYITNFVFFIGFSYAGTMISAILRVTQAEWRRPITRIAEAITVIALIIGVIQIWFDMGRPDRVLFLFLYGRIESPMLWDVFCIGVYLLSSLLYLYLPLIPDLAHLRDHMLDAAAWRRRLYTFLSLGWRGGAEQRRRLEKAIGIMAIILLPMVVSVHSVAAWIFGMTMQPMWHSTILGPYFVVGAIFSGIAMLFILMSTVRSMFHLEPWIGEKQYNYLGILLLVLSAFWAYFTLSEYLTTGYGSLTDEHRVLQAVLGGEFAPEFWIMLAGNLILPFAILIRRKGRTPLGTFIASVGIVIGMWIERFLIVTPTLTRPSLGLLPAVYTPSLTEIAISFGSMALLVLSFLLFFKVFPAISIWEVEEGEAVEAVRRKARELAQGEAVRPSI